MWAVSQLWRRIDEGCSFSRGRQTRLWESVHCKEMEEKAFFIGKGVGFEPGKGRGLKRRDAAKGPPMLVGRSFSGAWDRTLRIRIVSRYGVVHCNCFCCSACRELGYRCLMYLLNDMAPVEESSRCKIFLNPSCAVISRAVLLFQLLNLL